MALLDQPDQGTVRLLGTDTGDWTEENRCAARARDIGMVFQHFHLLPHHTLEENLLLAGAYLPEPDPDLPARAADLLARIGLAERRRHAARLLSGGEKQRLCIARALLNRPRLLLADEPTGNLDRANAGNVRGLFEQMSGPDTAVVVATHDPDWHVFAHRVLHFEADGHLREIRA
jgi:putative ABC transport system ATP-binding protein